MKVFFFFFEKLSKKKSVLLKWENINFWFENFFFFILKICPKSLSSCPFCDLIKFFDAQIHPGVIKNFGFDVFFFFLMRLENYKF